MSEKYLEDFAVGQIYGSGRITVEEDRDQDIRGGVRSAAFPPGRGCRAPLDIRRLGGERRSLRAFHRRGVCTCSGFVTT